MAVLGVGGKLVLRREAPDAVLCSDDAVDTSTSKIRGFDSNYWNGDKVTTFCLPVMGDGFPVNPEGYATYFGSKWYLGPNRTHISSNSDSFYKGVAETYPDGQAGNAAQFYSRVGDTVGGSTIEDCKQLDYWIHIDDLGYASFYEDRCGGLAGSNRNRVQLYPVAGNIGIAPHGSTEYANAVWECVRGFSMYEFSDFRDSVTLVSICADAPFYESPVAGSAEYDNADLQPRGLSQGSAWPYWQVIADLREWTLQLSAPTIDTTAISEKFGEAVKSLVSGSGSAEFLVDRKCFDDNNDNGLMLMKLVLMTEKGCKARAMFYVVNNNNNQGEDIGSVETGDLYYSAELLVTSSAVSLRPTDIVAGTVNFATTGAVRLLEAP
jgi:hypothetical protein